MLEMFSVALPLFVRVTTLAALVVPTGWLPNPRVAGETWAPACVPAPVKVTVCGELGALSVSTRDAARAPVAVALKSTFTVQESPGSSEAPQLFVCGKSPGFAPEIAMLVKVTVAPPRFDTVTGCEAVGCPNTALPKAKDEGETVKSVERPVPVKGMVWGLAGASSVKDKFALREPAAAGVKVSLTVQVAEGARVAAQVFAEITKSEAFVPVTVIEDMFRAALPVFISVTVMGADVVLTF